jgi:iron-sulfur cluster assembly protein
LYDLDVSEKIEEDDLTWEQHGVRFVVDEMSMIYLSGTTIDFGASLNNSGFQFINSSKRSCGCGSSFS